MTKPDGRSPGNSLRTFGRDRDRARLAGVCAGIARFFGIDPLIVRVVFSVGAIVGFGSFILIYLAIWLLAD